jgi:hypothetical protein
VCHNSDIIECLGEVMGSKMLTVELDGGLFEATCGDNLLESLLSKGAYVRHGCRAGACGACRLYDQTNCESILSCQTSVASAMSLTTHAPSVFSGFSVLSKTILNNANVELTLLGPSDELFGDRVQVSFLSAGNDVFFECMALNQTGAPLKVMLQEDQFSATEWQHVLALDIDDPLRVQLSSGVRKGRLLYEMGVNDGGVVVITSPENAPFEPYWREALAELSTQTLGYFVLSSSRDLRSCLQDEAFTAFFKKVFLKQASAGAGSPVLQIIYHGQKLSEKDWAQALAPLRIRTNQLHFVR